MFFRHINKGETTTFSSDLLPWGTKPFQTGFIEKGGKKKRVEFLPLEVYLHSICSDLFAEAGIVSAYNQVH